MNLVLNDLFTGLQDLREVAPTIDPGTTFSELNSSAISAKKQICNIITEPVYKTIIDGDDADLKSALSQALANAMMSKQLVFDVLKLRKVNQAVYKNELEAMRNSYADNYFNAMDSLLLLLESNDTWKATPYYVMKSKLKITSADDFNAFYPIDSSYLFFFRCIPGQREIIDDIVGTYFDRIASRDDLEDLEPRLKRALAKLTVAWALHNMDPMELPPTIRNLHDDSTSQRSTAADQTKMDSLSADLIASAMEILKNVDSMLTEDTEESYISESSFNRKDDKIYLLG